MADENVPMEVDTAPAGDAGGAPAASTNTGKKGRPSSAKSKKAGPVPYTAEPG